MGIGVAHVESVDEYVGEEFGVVSLRMCILSKIHPSHTSTFNRQSTFKRPSEGEEDDLPVPF